MNMKLPTTLPVHRRLDDALDISSLPRSPRSPLHPRNFLRSQPPNSQNQSSPPSPLLAPPPKTCCNSFNGSKMPLNYRFFPSKRLRLKSLKSHLTSQPLQPRKFPYSNSSLIETISSTNKIPTPSLNKEINQNSASPRFLRTKSRQSNKSSPTHFPA